MRPGCGNSPCRPTSPSARRHPGAAQDNAEFAARHITHAELYVIPGRVDHDIFINECDDDGRNEFPQACIDAPGVDRGKIHALIGDAALKFFDASLNVPRGK